MRSLLTILISLACTSLLWSQPQPGDVFREYTWLPVAVQSPPGRFLRVGGPLDYRINPQHFPENRHHDGFISLDQFLDLDDAIRAEISVEKIASHVDTKGFRVAVNGHASHVFPPLPDLPQPESAYMYHAEVTVSIPLEELKHGTGNTFSLAVDSTQRWDWPQHLVHGVTFRIYYEKADWKTFQVQVQADSGKWISHSARLSLDAPNASIREVQYLAHYEGVDYEGNGTYRQWHGSLRRGTFTHHIGTADHYPFVATWRTDWIPDQDQPMKFAARVVRHDGLIYFTEAHPGWQLVRPFGVLLAKPLGTPKNWVTRSMEFETYFEVPPHVHQIDSARVIWNSWSPCYSAGIFLNDQLVFDQAGPCYEALEFSIPILGKDLIHPGKNHIRSGQTPRHEGQMVHGMEVQWPGITCLIRYFP
ncbi:hypothetical protein [Pontibacter sp. G13]|uniref:hypothetical protein n=1 Tax=Pontibacter sp. G13 TaxID=3074898 RepID=UPI002889FB14|nr:hypothetical protein [Pontibacter sp. G13]WNJ20222.1 hypothetical protein RJD25_07055 [Pontibacter sp. G13]